MDVMSRAQVIFKEQALRVQSCTELRCEALMHAAVEIAKLEQRNAAQSKNISGLMERLAKQEATQGA